MGFYYNYDKFIERAIRQFQEDLRQNQGLESQLIQSKDFKEFNNLEACKELEDCDSVGEFEEFSIVMI